MKIVIFLRIWALLIFTMIGNVSMIMPMQDLSLISELKIVASREERCAHARECIVHYHDIKDKVTLHPSRMNALDHCGETLMHYAAQLDDAQTMQDLHARGADINIMNMKKRTPLSYAIEYDAHNAAEWLINQGAHIHAALLNHAAYRGNIKIADLLIKRGARLNVLTGYLNESPLHAAVKAQSFGMVHFLVDVSGANINFCNDGNMTAVDIAALYYPALIPYLIDRGGLSGRVSEVSPKLKK